METNRDYIPMIWKKWYSLIRGIEKGWIVPGNDADDTLKDLIINLEAEAGQSIKGFQSEILDLEDPNMVLDELEAAARKILKEYSAAQDALTAFTPEVIAAFRTLSADCDVVVQLTSLVSNKNNISLEEEIGTIHKLTSGHSFRGLSLESFRNLVRINSTATADSPKLVPLPGGELSFHTLLVILMLRSHLYSDMASPIHHGIWSGLYSGKIYWSETADHNSWINNYIYDETPVLEDTPSDSDRSLLEDFLERRSFERICDKEVLISNEFSEYAIDRIKILTKVARIGNDRRDTLRRLYKLLHDETDYLLKTRDQNSGHFLSEEDAHQVYMDDQFLQHEHKALENRVERIFRDEDPDNTDILSLLDQLDDFRFYVPLSDKPIVNSSMIKRIIDSCVLNNETVKSILRDAIMEDRLIEEISGEEGAKDIQGKVAKTSPDQGGIETAMAELRSGGYIDNEGAINLSGAKFARHLVKSGYVKPGKSWRPWFRNPEWLDFSEDGVISNNEIQEITKELNWKPFDGVFKDKDGKKLSSSNLSKFFSDGDSSYTKRNAIFLQIYRRFNHKI